ncbi:MAG: hypothetical protein K2H26_03845, partial [Ruminococcus sp.]|nr:hypothetical protein [Ruminococcus sp.]
MTDSTSYEIILSYMPLTVRNAMYRVSEKDRTATEIRLRCGRAVSYIFPDRIKYLTRNGQLTESFRNPETVTVTSDDVKQTVEKLWHFSVHSCTKELHEGY